jgi:putative intracellular protease/amidase
MSKKRLLMIVTSHDTLGNTGVKTGFWLEELAAPYLEFRRAGLDLHIASPAGGQPAIDPKSEGEPTPAAIAFLQEPVASAQLASTQRLTDVKPDYDAYFVAGGHGAMWDLPDNTALQTLLALAHENGKVVAAVCHGPAALVNVRLSSGRYLVDGKRVSAFTNEEEAAVGLEKVVPFALESRLKERGARFEGAPLWTSFAVRDGTLVTGQNPASSLAAAQEVLKALGCT